MMNPRAIKVLWMGIERSWHQLEWSDDAGMGWAMICDDELGHFEVENLLEIYYQGKLMFRSKDIWFPGMLKIHG